MTNSFRVTQLRDCQQTMRASGILQIIGNVAKADHPENWLPHKDNSNAHGKYGTYLLNLRGEREGLHQSRAQRLVILSLYVIIDKIMYSAGDDATDEITGILYEKYLDLEFFKEKVKSHQWCQKITQYMFERCK